VFGQHHRAQDSGALAELWRHHVLVDFFQHRAGANVTVQQLGLLLSDPRVELFLLHHAPTQNDAFRRKRAYPRG